MIDLTQEDEMQASSGLKYGPVPEGSAVFVQLEVLKPSRPCSDNPYYSEARSGFRQLYVKLTVAEGSYQGQVSYQNISLPISEQKIRLSDGQERAARIGGAILKAICLSSGANQRLNTITDLTGKIFPCVLRIQKKPTIKNDKVYWNNEIHKVLIPKDPQFLEIQQRREIINENGVVYGDLSLVPEDLRETVFEQLGLTHGKGQQQGIANQGFETASFGQNDWGQPGNGQFEQQPFQHYQSFSQPTQSYQQAQQGQQVQGQQGQQYQSQAQSYAQGQQGQQYQAQKPMNLSQNPSQQDQMIDSVPF